MDPETKDNLTDLTEMDEEASSSISMEDGQVSDKDDGVVTLGN
jgi:hypothetical protein